MNVSSPVALTLTGATALRGLVARTRRVKRRLRGNPRSRLRLPGLQLCAVWSPGQARQAPPPGKSPVALTRATALRGLVARTGASSAASGKIPGRACAYRGYSSARSGRPDRRVKRRLRGNPGRACAYRGYSSARSGSPDRRVKRRLRGNPRSRSRLPGLRLCAVWSPGQARQAPPPGKSPVALTLIGATALRGMVARTGASSAASGEIPGRAHAYRGYGSARSGRPDRRVKRRLRENTG